MLSLTEGKFLLTRSSYASLKQCKEIHAQLIATGSIFQPTTALTNLLKSIIAADADDLHYALAVFRHIPKPSTFLWNTIIRACSRHNAPKQSISLYLQLRRGGIIPDLHTFRFLFKASALCSSVQTGQASHADFLKQFTQSHVEVENSLIHMYSQFGWVDTARCIFDNMSIKDVVSWTTIVAGYAKGGLMDEAQKIFDQMLERNVVSWTSMVAGYAQAGQAEEAVGTFKKMILEGVKPDAVTMVSVLSACAQLRDSDMGRWVHQFIGREGLYLSENLAVALIDLYAKCGDMNAACQVFHSMNPKILPAWNAIIDGYCKLGNVDIARSLFDQMEERDLISFDSMMTGYIQNSFFKEAFLLFSKLRASSLKPDKFMVAGLLTACANLGALDQGKSLHAYIVENFIELDVFLGTALLDMYAKCGRIDQAMLIFNGMPRKDVLSWSAMISGLAVHGHGTSALAHFSMMREQGVMPNSVTYIGALSACSHSGLVEQGYLHFHEMMCVYNIEPEIEHYGCMVDLLCRAGRLKEAEALIQNMPIEPNVVIWGSLLGACRVYNDIQLAERAANHLLVLEPQRDAAYTLLHNIYASSGKWAQAAEIRKIMEQRGIRKTVGCSSIVVDGCIHEFVAGDRLYPQFEDTLAMVGEITKHLSLAGYAPSTSQVSLDKDE